MRERDMSYLADVVTIRVHHIHLTVRKTAVVAKNDMPPIRRPVRPKRLQARPGQAVQIPAGRTHHPHRGEITAAATVKRDLSSIRRKAWVRVHPPPTSQDTQSTTRRRD